MNKNTSSMKHCILKAVLSLTRACCFLNLILSFHLNHLYFITILNYVMPLIILFRYVEAGTLMNNYAHIFDLLTRLRQVNFTIPIHRCIFLFSFDYYRRRFDLDTT